MWQVKLPGGILVQQLFIYWQFPFEMNYLPALFNMFYSIAKTVWGADMMIILYGKREICSPGL